MHPGQSQPHRGSTISLSVLWLLNGNLHLKPECQTQRSEHHLSIPPHPLPHRPSGTVWLILTSWGSLFQHWYLHLFIQGNGDQAASVIMLYPVLADGCTSARAWSFTS